MASHLTVTSTGSAGAAMSKGLSLGAEADASGASANAFAALLAGSAEPDAAPSQTGQGNLDINLGNLVDLSLDFGSGEGEAPDNPDALAAMVNAILPVQVPTQPVAVLAEFSDLVDSLADIKARPDAGEPLDAEMFKRVDASLDRIAQALDLDLDALPNLADLANMLQGAGAPAQTPLQSATDTLAQFAQSLLSGEASAAASANAELPPLVKSVGDKLANLLAALGSGETDLTALGLTDEANKTLDPRLEAALARLATPTAKAEAAVPVVVLAKPQLEVTEPALSGKGDATSTIDGANDAASNTKADNALQPVNGPEASDKPDNGRKDQHENKRASEIGVVASAAISDQPMAQSQASTLTQHQASRIDAAAAPRTVQVGYQTSQQQLNLPQLAFEVARQANDGNTRFQIRLDPAELGRIDVKLDIDAAGQVNARMTVEKPETLDLMQRDQRGLERALQQAGLDTSKTTLEFSLRQNPFGGGQNQNQGHGNQSPFSPGAAAADGDDAPVPPTINLYRGSLSASGVNIIA